MSVQCSSSHCRIVRNKSPGYLYKYISPGDRACLIRNNNIKQILCRSEYFLILFFSLYTIKEWNKLRLEIRNSESYSLFKKSLLKFTRTIPNSVFSVPDIYGIKLLTRLRVGLSHLREHIVCFTHYTFIFNASLNRHSKVRSYF